MAPNRPPASSDGTAKKAKPSFLFRAKKATRLGLMATAFAAGCADMSRTSNAEKKGDRSQPEFVLVPREVVQSAANKTASVMTDYMERQRYKDIAERLITILTTSVIVSLGTLFWKEYQNRKARKNEMIINIYRTRVLYDKDAATLQLAHVVIDEYRLGELLKKGELPTAFRKKIQKIMDDESQNVHAPISFEAEDMIILRKIRDMVQAVFSKGSLADGSMHTGAMGVFAKSRLHHDEMVGLSEVDIHVVSLNELELLQNSASNNTLVEPDQHCNLSVLFQRQVEHLARLSIAESNQVQPIRIFSHPTAES